MTLLLVSVTNVFAIPVNNDVALTAFKGQVIIREQIRFTRKSGDGSSQDRVVNRLEIPNVISYGITDRVTALAIYPIIYQETNVKYICWPPKKRGRGVW